jgi:hypothetical protein
LLFKDPIGYPLMNAWICNVSREQIDFEKLG